jgi:hypothetical protein
VSKDCGLPQETVRYFSLVMKLAVISISNSQGTPAVQGEGSGFEGVRGISHDEHGGVVGINDGSPSRRLREPEATAAGLKVLRVKACAAGPKIPTMVALSV